MFLLKIGVGVGVKKYLLLKLYLLKIIFIKNYIFKSSVS